MSNGRLISTQFKYSFSDNNIPLCSVVSNYEKTEVFNLLNPEQEQKAEARRYQKNLQAYRITIRNFLDAQFNRLPKNSEKYKQLLIVNRYAYAAININELKAQAVNLRAVVSQHRDTGMWGFFKCTLFRCTQGAKEFDVVFDANNKPRQGWINKP